MNDLHDDDLVRRLERLADLSPDGEATRRALDRVRAALLETVRPLTERTSQKRMHLNRALVAPVAACLLLACGVALFVLNSTHANAFAQVIKAAETHNLVRIQAAADYEAEKSRGRARQYRLRRSQSTSDPERKSDQLSRW